MSADGTWNVTMNTPMGPQAGVLKLATDGSALTGTMSGPQGETAVEEGKVDGNKLTWVVNVTTPMAIKVEVAASVDGDQMTGEAKLGPFGAAAITGTRG